MCNSYTGLLIIDFLQALVFLKVSCSRSGTSAHTNTLTANDSLQHLLYGYWTVVVSLRRLKRLDLCHLNLGYCFGNSKERAIKSDLYLQCCPHNTYFWLTIFLFFHPLWIWSVGIISHYQKPLLVYICISQLATHLLNRKMTKHKARSETDKMANHGYCMCTLDLKMQIGSEMLVVICMIISQ